MDEDGTAVELTARLPSDLVLTGPDPEEAIER